MIDWSILVLTTPRRVGKMFPDMMNNLNLQVGDRPIEVLGLFDNKRRSVGLKREAIKSIAQGKYISFIDDDDKIAHNYVEKIHHEIVNNPGVDIINFNVVCRVDGGAPKMCHYSLKYGTTVDLPREWYGPPAHTSVWKRELADSVPYPDKQYKEDVAWVKDVVKLAKTEVQIPHVLYYYNFDSNISETRDEL